MFLIVSFTGYLAAVNARWAYFTRLNQVCHSYCSRMAKSELSLLRWPPHHYEAAAILKYKQREREYGTNETEMITILYRDTHTDTLPWVCVIYMSVLCVWLGVCVHCIYHGWQSTFHGCGNCCWHNSALWFRSDFCCCILFTLSQFIDVACHSRLGLSFMSQAVCTWPMSQSQSQQQLPLPVTNCIVALSKVETSNQ